MIPKAFGEINRPAIAHLCRGNSRIALTRANAKRRGVLPYALLLRSTFVAFALILSQTGLVFSSTAPASQKPDSTIVVAKDTFDVSEAQMSIIYPKGKSRRFEPGRSREPNRAGSFVNIKFDIEYDRVDLYEILFHTFASCSVFAPGWEKALAESGYNDGEGFPKRWYSPDDFINQRLAFENKDSLPSFRFITIGDKNYFYTCNYYEPGGAYVIEAITFIGEVRITVHMLTSYRHNCDTVYEESKNLLSKIELIPYQPAKNDKR